MQRPSGRVLLAVALGVVGLAAIALVLRGAPAMPSRSEVKDAARAFRSPGIWRVRALDLKAAALGRFSRGRLEPVAA